jgi:SAM-dependent methyltransferase
VAREPGRYTHGHHESVLRSHRWRTAENSAGYLLPRLRAGVAVLDVGCGPGTVTTDLAALVAPGPVLGIDVSAQVIDQARAGVAGDGPGPRFAVADLYDLAAGSAGREFDVVHAHQVLQHLPDPVGALRTMAALTGPGGLVAARDGDYAGMHWYPPVPELEDWRQLYRAAARANGGEPDAGRRLLGWARAAGLRDVTASASVWCFATDEDRQWWAGTWADRIVDSALARQLVDSGLAEPDRLRRIAAGWRRWADRPDGWFAVPHGEVLCRVGPAPS